MLNYLENKKLKVFLLLKRNFEVKKNQILCTFSKNIKDNKKFIIILKLRDILLKKYFYCKYKLIVKKKERIKTALISYNKIVSNYHLSKKLFIKKYCFNLLHKHSNKNKIFFKLEYIFNLHKKRYFYNLKLHFSLIRFQTFYEKKQRWNFLTTYIVFVRFNKKCIALNKVVDLFYKKIKYNYIFFVTLLERSFKKKIKVHQVLNLLEEILFSQNARSAFNILFLFSCKKKYIENIIKLKKVNIFKKKAFCALKKMLFKIKNRNIIQNFLKQFIFNKNKHFFELWKKNVFYQNKERTYKLLNKYFKLWCLTSKENKLLKSFMLERTNEEDFNISLVIYSKTDRLLAMLVPHFSELKNDSSSVNSLSLFKRENEIDIDSKSFLDNSPRLF